MYRTVCESRDFVMYRTVSEGQGVLWCTVHCACRECAWCRTGQAMQT